MKLKECSPKEFKLCSGIFKSLSLKDWCVHDVWSVIVHSAQILALLKIKSKCAIYFIFYISYEAGSHSYLSPGYICILTFSHFSFCSVWARMLQLLVLSFFFLRDLKSLDVRNVSFFSQHFTNTMYLPHFLYKTCQLSVITVVNTLCMY